MNIKRFLLLSLSFATFTSVIFCVEGWATVFKTSRRLSGFSPDSSHYIYLESSRNSVTDVPTAQIQLVEIATNSCVINGCLKTDYDYSSSNISSQAAEDNLLEKTLLIRQTLKLNQLKSGTRLPIVFREIKPDRSETIKALLNPQTKPLQIRLEQKYIPSVLSRRGTADVERTAMRLVINYNNRKLTLGDLNNYREAVQKYSIREVRLSPNERNVVVLIDMTQPTYEGVLQTTFVQSFPL